MACSCSPTMRNGPFLRALDGRACPPPCARRRAPCTTRRGGRAATCPVSRSVAASRRGSAGIAMAARRDDQCNSSPRARDVVGTPATADLVRERLQRLADRRQPATARAQARSHRHPPRTEATSTLSLHWASAASAASASPTGRDSSRASALPPTPATWCRYLHGVAPFCRRRFSGELLAGGRHGALACGCSRSRHDAVAPTAGALGRIPRSAWGLDLIVAAGTGSEIGRTPIRTRHPS